MSKGLGFTAIPDAQQKCYWSPTSFVSYSNLLLTGMRTAVSCTSPGQEGDRAGQRDLLAQHGFHRHQVEHLCSVSICCSLCWYQCWGQSILQIRRAQWQKQIAHHLGMHSYTAQTVFLKYSVIAQYPPSEESKAWITANLSLPVNLEKLKRWIIIPHVEKLKEGLLSPTYRPRRKSRLRLQLHHVLDHALGDMRIRGDVGTQLRLPESNHVNQPQMLPPPPKLHNRLVRRTLLHQASCSLSYVTYSSFALLWKKYPMILTRWIGCFSAFLEITSGRNRHSTAGAHLSTAAGISNGSCTDLLHWSICTHSSAEQLLVEYWRIQAKLCLLPRTWSISWLLRRSLLSHHSNYDVTENKTVSTNCSQVEAALYFQSSLNVSALLHAMKCNQRWQTRERRKDQSRPDLC